MPRPLAILLVLAVSGPGFADPVVTKLIDAEITARLRKENVPPAGRADDATLLRRIYLDLLGRPPTGDEARSYLDDPAQDKHHRLIDRLRFYPEATAHGRLVLAGWLRPDAGSDGNLSLFLASAAAQNLSWDVIARRLLDPPLTATEGKTARAYLGGFLRAGDVEAGRDALTVAVASGFLGAQLQCARCHDHPTVPEWTQKKYRGLRAPFATLRAGGFPENELWEGVSATKAPVPLFLDGTPLPTDKPRAGLVAHAIRAESPYLARAVVNRAWKQLLGRGLVEPVDMIHAGNPASHPALFAALTDDFVRNQYDLDRLVAGIMHSEVYLRSARRPVAAADRPPDYLFAVAKLRPLSPDQTACAIAVATGVLDVTDVRRVGWAKSVGASPDARNKLEATTAYRRITDVFRPAGDADASTAAHALYLAFDPTIARLLDPKTGRLVPALAAAETDEAAAELAYLSVLARRPTPDELAVVKAHLKAAASREAACQDLAWALMAGAEFRFNH
jgi:hypothetical protein